MTKIEIATNFFANCSGFTAKQIFTFHGLTPVRTELQSSIASVSRKHFNSFASSMIGNQLGLILAIPVTCFIGDLISSAVKETILTISELIKIHLLGIKERKPKAFFKDLFIKIIKYATYFFSRNYFCNYCMPAVKVLADGLSRHVVVLSGAKIASHLLAGTLSVVITPPLTFLLGEVVGIVARETMDEFLKVCQKVL